MLKFGVYLLAGLVAIMMMFADAEAGPVTLLVVGLLAVITVVVLRRYTEERAFLTNVFIAGLCARLIFGMVVHVYGLRDFVGPDSLTYDLVGEMIAGYWGGTLSSDPILKDMLSIRGPGWGMNYFMGIVYFLFGRNVFIAQSICAFFGAATVPMVYFCCRGIFQNKATARTAAVLVAFFPALVIWSSQLLKDGLIVFLLVVAVTMVVRLQHKLDWVALTVLAIASAGILSLRFYTFYVVAVAIGGSFAIGVNTTLKATVQRLSALAVLALALTYFGVIRVATVDFNTYGSLERIQHSRVAMTQSDSGYGGDVDVSTAGGAVAAMPTGFAYLMFAPFPWEMKNLRQALTLPDVLLWWAMIPLMIYGLIYSLKNKLRANISILLFTFILTLAYSMFQGNLGAAYRQRTQIQVFLMIFVAVGWSILMERRADRKLVEERRLKSLFNRQGRLIEHSHQLQ